MLGSKIGWGATTLSLAGVMLGGCGRDASGSRRPPDEVRDTVQCLSCGSCLDDHLSDPLLNSYLQLTLRLAERLEEHATILSEAVERVSATDASPESVGA